MNSLTFAKPFAITLFSTAAFATSLPFKAVRVFPRDSDSAIISLAGSESGAKILFEKLMAPVETSSDGSRTFKSKRTSTVHCWETQYNSGSDEEALYQCTVTVPLK